MGFFLIQWGVLVLGGAAHIAVDRHPDRRTATRVYELIALWAVVGGGAWTVFGGIGHIGPTSDEIADGIGYTQSMFQWEVGWADIAIGAAGIACAWKANRGGWTSAAVFVLLVYFWGDGIGHIVQWTAHDNTEPMNVWAIPADFLQPLIAVVFLALYRRGAAGAHARPGPAPDGPRESSVRRGRLAP
ncbi:DUF6790 family protein [Rhodococcus sp. SGAir0479]|uniref:DUF6790 family protein n=1 Tax=Rhodococcus sp. SGAir0479 TaxID=2567884 RepID=UPI0020C82C4D|nr:DUF6790 family protein [Rhodococcus sp. SGAir0479]